MKTLMDIEFKEIKIIFEDTSSVSVLKNDEMKRVPLEEAIMSEFVERDEWIVKYNMMDVNQKNILKEREQYISLNIITIRMFMRRYKERFESVTIDNLKRKGINFKELFIYGVGEEHYRGAMNNSPLVLELKKLEAKLKIVFMETNRLFGNSISSRRDNERVSECSEGIKRILNACVNKYSEESQKVDKTFPMRVIEEMKNPKEIDVANLREKFKALKIKREELDELGLLFNDVKEEELEKNLNLEKNILSILNLYMIETTKKFNVFAKEEEKLKAFLDIINNRIKFYRKKMFIDKDRGIYFISDTERDFSVDKLSSGEKNILILFYDFLFGCEKNTLILIDEPEISLHVKWQMSLVKILLEIKEIVENDVIIATHSPEIVGKYREYMVRMGKINV